MIDKLFIDSNVWIYLFTNEDNIKCKIAENFILENGVDNILVISYQVVNEVTSVLKKKKYSEQQIRFVIEKMTDACTVINYSKTDVLSASEIRENHSFSFWDSHIIASAVNVGCNYLISEDMQDGRNIGGMIIKNIFE
ncbi:DNA-binding protein [Bacteroidia bacterium]|nr:DNA-binding protein [Bacteroidia bacterium]